MSDQAASAADRFVSRYGATWQAWDVEAFVNLFTEDIDYVAHPDEIVNGRAALRRYLEKEKGAQGLVQVQMGRPIVDGERLMAEFWVLADDDASIAGCLIARLGPDGTCSHFREYWFDLEGSRGPFDGWGS